MDRLQLLNTIGISVEIIGVLLVAKSDLLSKRTGAAFDAIPGNLFVEQYNAAKNGELRFASNKERGFWQLSKQSNERRALLWFRAALLLIAAGMLMQLIAAILGP